MTNLGSIGVNTSCSKTVTITSIKDPSNIARASSIVSKRININICAVNIRNDVSVTLTSLTEVVCNCDIVSQRINNFIRSKASNQLFEYHGRSLSNSNQQVVSKVEIECFQCINMIFSRIEEHIICDGNVINVVEFHTEILTFME